MKQNLIAKINKTINDGIEKESEVLYILAQCRKFLENSIDRELKYPALSLFGDWVLHRELTGKGAKGKLKEYADFLSSEENDAMFKFMQNEFTLFSDLKSDLLILSREYGLNSGLMVNKKTWRKFISLLVEILRGLPLIDKEQSICFKFDQGFFVQDKEAIEFVVSLKNGQNKIFSVDLEIYT